MYPRSRSHKFKKNRWKQNWNFYFKFTFDESKTKNRKILTRLDLCTVHAINFTLNDKQKSTFSSRCRNSRWCIYFRNKFKVIIGSFSLANFHKDIVVTNGRTNKCSLTKLIYIHVVFKLQEICLNKKKIVNVHLTAKNSFNALFTANILFHCRIHF